MKGGSRVRDKSEVAARHPRRESGGWDQGEGSGMERRRQVKMFQIKDK